MRVGIAFVVGMPTAILAMRRAERQLQLLARALNSWPGVNGYVVCDLTDIPEAGIGASHIMGYRRRPSLG